MALEIGGDHGILQIQKQHGTCGRQQDIRHGPTCQEEQEDHDAEDRRQGGAEVCQHQQEQGDGDQTAAHKATIQVSFQAKL